MKRPYTSLVLWGWSLLTLFNQVGMARAQDQKIEPHAGDVTAAFPTPEDAIKALYANVFRILTLIAGFLAIIMLIYYGILYITSAGDPTKAKTARAGIINAIIGVIVISAAYFIIRVASSLGSEVSKIGT